MKGWIAFGALFSLTASARAEEPSRVHFRLESPSGCASVSEFSESFATRSRSIRLESGDVASPIVVRFEDHETSVIALLSVRLDDGSIVTRRLEAKNCFEAREAMAFVLALALDPEHLDEKKPPPSLDARPSAEEFAAPPPFRDERPKVEEPARLGFGVGVLGASVIGLSPEPSFGGGLGFEVRRFLRDEPNGPSMRFEVRHGVALDRTTPGGVAHFETSSLSLALCPFELPLGELRVRPCASGMLGGLVAEGRNTLDGARHFAEFGALGANVLADFPFGKTARLGLGAGGLLPFRRDSYQFDSNVFFVTEPIILDSTLALFLFFG